MPSLSPETMHMVTSADPVSLRTRKDPTADIAALVDEGGDTSTCQARGSSDTFTLQSSNEMAFSPLH